MICLVECMVQRMGEIEISVEEFNQEDTWTRLARSFRLLFHRLPGAWIHRLVEASSRVHGHAGLALGGIMSTCLRL